MRVSRTTLSGASRHLLVLVTAALAWGGLCSQARGGDTQYWNEVIFEFGLCDRLDAAVALEQKVVDDITDFGLANVTFEPSCAVRSWLSLGPGIRYEREKNAGQWMTEHRYWLHATFKHELAGFRAKVKSKLEFRDLEGDDMWRSRTKFKIQRPLELGALEIAPFLSEEPFYDFSANQWNQIRSAVGVAAGLTANIELAVYYMHVAKRSNNDWNTTHVIGTEIVWAF